MRRVRGLSNRPNRTSYEKVMTETRLDDFAYRVDVRDLDSRRPNEVRSSRNALPFSRFLRTSAFSPCYIYWILSVVSRIISGSISWSSPTSVEQTRVPRLLLYKASDGATLMLGW